MFVRDSLDGSKGPLKVERTGGPDRDASGVGSGFGSGGDIGFDEVSGAESEVGLGGCQVATRKAVFGEAGSLMRAASEGLDCQRGLVPALKAGNPADASGVLGVGFGNPEPAPVELGLSTGSGFNGELGFPEFSEECEACGVDGRCRRQALLGAGKDLVP